jgi:hypothetical protein
MLNKEWFIKFLYKIFLFCLLLILFYQFFNLPIFWFDFKKYLIVTNFLNNLRITQYWIVILSIVSWSLILYVNRHKILDIESEREIELLEEERRKIEFSNKFPKINKVPFLRWIFKWIYKEWFIYSIWLILLTFIWFSIRIYNIWELWLWRDEIITWEIVKRIIETWLPIQSWDLMFYWRWVFYHYLIVPLVYLLWENETWLRFPSVIFWLLICLWSYILWKKINKKIWFLTFTFLIFSTYNIEYSRMARFYIMNAFFYLLFVQVFFNWFFQNKTKFKILSLLISIFIQYIVQLGAFFIIPVIIWAIYNNINLLILDNSFIKKIKSILINKNNVYFLLFLIILYLWNIFEFFNIYWTTTEFTQSKLWLTFLINSQSWSYFSYPQWYIYDFFSKYYINILFMFPLFILLIYRIRLKIIWYFEYLLLVLLLTIFFYEILNRGVTWARIYIFIEPLVVLLFILTIFLIFNKNILKTIIIILLTFLSINPNFIQRITLYYWDTVENDPFRNTHVAKYRSDNKNTYIFLKNHIKKEDIWITVMWSSYFYFSRVPNYTLNQNVNWNKSWFLDSNWEYRTLNNSILISTVSDIKRIISSNKWKRVYILVNWSSINVLSTIHVTKDFLDFIDENKNKIIYKSPDKFSSVMLFE